MTVTAIKIVSVPVSDPDRAKDYYSGVLGLEVIEDEPMGDTMRWVRLAPSGSSSSIALVTWFESMPAGSLKGLVLSVDDIEVAAAELAAKGVATANGIESAPWGRFVQLDDPDGNGIILQQDNS